VPPPQQPSHIQQQQQQPLQLLPEGLLTFEHLAWAAKTHGRTTALVAKIPATRLQDLLQGKLARGDCSKFTTTGLRRHQCGRM
jgi:hypothetical protein